LHTIEHSQGSIDARLCGLPVAAHDAKLRIATAYKNPSIAAWPIILVIVHDAPAPVVPVAIPPVGVVMPAVVTIIIVPR
jgi:hypothetical protein